MKLFNFLGDHYKGNSFKHLSEDAIRGIQLHRQIDHFIDNHPDVRQLSSLLSKDLPKIHGIAIDIYFDYLLATNWDDYHMLELYNFLDSFFAELDNHAELIPVEHLERMKRFKNKRFLYHYNDFESVGRIAEMIDHKLKNRTKMFHAPIVFHTFEKEIKDCFLKYMQDAQKSFRFI